MQTTTRFEQVDIDKLVPYVRNARTHSKEQIAQLRASLREFGFVSPVLIDKDYNILAGHGRIEAARAEGMTEVPCIFVEHLTDAQKRAYMLADNRLALNAGWDEELLALEFADLRDLGFDLEVTGFGVDEIEKLFADDGGEVVDDDFALDDALKEPSIVKQGDLWLLQGKAGTHRILCADSTDGENVARLMDGRKAQLLCTDAPYFVKYTSKGKTIKNDDLDDKSAYEFILKALQLAAGVLSHDASAYMFHADSKGLIFRRAWEDAGYYLSAVCLWVKNTFTFGRQNYKWCHESCLYGWLKTGTHKWFGDQKQSTCWHVDKPSKNEFHITQKPLELMAIPIRNSTMTNGLVYEPFSGSFSTGMVCEQLGRVCYAMELDESYLSASLRRYRESYPTAEITCERDGKTYTYADLVREVAKRNG